MGIWNWGKGKKRHRYQQLQRWTQIRYHAQVQLTTIRKYGTPFQRTAMCSVDIVISCSCVRNLQRQSEWINTSMVQLTRKMVQTMTFEIFSIICLIATIAIVPIYMWLLYNIKNSWTSNSHDTQGGSMTIVKDDLKVTFKDPVVKK